MSETTNSTETPAVFTREDGTTYTIEPFKLSKTKEVADRFRGDHTINIPLPVAAGEVQAGTFLAEPQTYFGALAETLRNLAAFVAPEANFCEVLVAKFNGQGLRLDLQKAAKDFLAPGGEETKDLEVADALAAAQAAVDAERLGAPRKRGQGGAKGKVAQAEAKTAKVANTALDMYRALPAAMREQYRAALIETGAVTQEELDQVDQELANPQTLDSAEVNRQAGRRQR